MDAIEVPEVRQLPELPPNHEDAVAFADMVLTFLMDHENALLHAESEGEHNASVSWWIRPRGKSGPAQEIEIAISPRLSSFRAVLARFGHHYLGGQSYHGYAARGLRQGNKACWCHIYMSNAGQAGFWIRVYAGRME